jgi:hypothetical protein
VRRLLHLSAGPQGLAVNLVGRFRVFRIKIGGAFFSMLIVIGAGLLLAACGGGSSNASQQELASAERHARQEKTEKEKERRLERKLAKLEHENREAKQHKRRKEQSELKERDAAHVTVIEAPPSSEPSGTDCGGGVTAGPETSCGFAFNVREAYEVEIGEGSGTVDAWSEANEEEYSMFCTSAPHECEGAITATVYFP